MPGRRYRARRPTRRRRLRKRRPRHSGLPFRPRLPFSTAPSSAIAPVPTLPPVPGADPRRAAAAGGERAEHPREERSSPRSSDLPRSWRARASVTPPRARAHRRTSSRGSGCRGRRRHRNEPGPAGASRTIAARGAQRRAHPQSRARPPITHPDCANILGQARPANGPRFFSHAPPTPCRQPAARQPPSSDTGSPARNGPCASTVIPSARP